MSLDQGLLITPNLTLLLGRLWLHASASMIPGPTAVRLCSHYISDYLAYGPTCVEQLYLRRVLDTVVCLVAKLLCQRCVFRFGVAFCLLLGNRG